MKTQLQKEQNERRILRDQLDSSQSKPSKPCTKCTQNRTESSHAISVQTDQNIESPSSTSAHGSDLVAQVDFYKMSEKYKDAKSKFFSLKERYDLLIEKNEVLQKSAAEIHREHESLVEKHLLLEGNNKEVGRKYAQLKGVCELRGKEIDRLKEQLKKEINEHIQSVDDRQKVEVESGLHKKEIEHLKGQLKKLKGESEQNESKITHLKQQLQREIRDHLKTVSSAEGCSEFSETIEKLRATEEKYSQLNKKYQTLKEICVFRGNEVDKLKQRLAQTNESVIRDNILQEKNQNV